VGEIIFKSTNFSEAALKACPGWTKYHWANIITSTKYYTTPLKIERNMLGRFIDEKYVCNLYKNVILPGCTFTFSIQDS